MNPVLSQRSYVLSLRTVSTSVALTSILFLDCLSLSSHAAPVANEGGNEYIQEDSPRQEARPVSRAILRGKLPRQPFWFIPSERDGSILCGIGEKPYERGTASWYGPGFQGRPMKNGQPYDMEAATVAHKDLPMGTRVCIRNPENDRVVLATVTDRGPFIKGRIVDLSKGLARALDIKLGTVEIFVI